MTDTHTTDTMPAPVVDPVVPAPIPPHDPFAMPVYEPAVDEKTTAAMRLREFEDRNFGKHAVRINGRIERGFGSQFKVMSAEKHAEYEALEKLVDAEQKLEDATSALFHAKLARDEAEAAVEKAIEVADAKAAEVEAADKVAV